MKNKDIVQIKRIDTLDNSQLNQLAGLYARVFAGPPWNEITKCATSKTFFGPETTVGNPCPDCGSALQEAYPTQETVEYIVQELSKPNPLGFLAYVQGELAGFSWGYETTVQEIAKSKWNTPRMQQTIQETLTELGVIKPLFYGSETGVDPQFRGQGIGKKLFETRLAFAKKNQNFVLTRTNVNSPMYGISKQTAWVKQIFGPTASKPLFSKSWKNDNKYITGIDKENTERVLFLYDEEARETSEYDTRGPGWYGQH